MNVPTQSGRPVTVITRPEIGWRYRGVLQRNEKGRYQDYLIGGKLVVNPFDVETLPRGWYRLRVP